MNEDSKISLIGGFILTTLTLISGISIFLIMQQQTNSLLNKTLEASLQNNVQLFENRIRYEQERTSSIAFRPSVIRNFVSLSKNQKLSPAINQLDQIAQSLLSNGFTGVTFSLPNGSEIVNGGFLEKNPELNVELNSEISINLLWSKEFIIQITAKVFDQKNNLLGFVTTDTKIPELTKTISNVSSIGKSAELAICAPLENDMQCFPLTITKKVLKRISRMIEGKPLPMSYALDNKVGVVFALDYRKEQVVAAFSPIGKSGLGMVLKVDQTELFSPIKTELKFVITIVIVLVFSGMLLLYLLVTPLVRKLTNSQKEILGVNKQLKESEEKLQTILDSSPVAIAWANEKRVIEYTNNKFIELFGHKLEEIPTIEDWYLLAFPNPSYRENKIPIWEANIANSRLKNISIPPMELEITAKDSSIRNIILAGAWAGPRLLLTFSDISERKKAEEQINHLAFYDTLTFLPNRRLLMLRIQQAIDFSELTNQKGSLLIIDLDNFKSINDTNGHDVGDLLLQQVAQRLTACINEGDTVARIGGDEFGVLLLHSNSQNLDVLNFTEVLAKKILFILSLPYFLNQIEFQGTASIGITIFQGSSQIVDDLMKQADIAMYNAKKLGRNNVCFFDPQMQAAVNAHSALESDMRKAIDNNQFKLYYQMQVDSSKRIFGAEALIRWIHPVIGLIPPLQFISIAEESNLIIDLGQWIIETACEQLMRWKQHAKTSGLILAINISAKQFRQTDFPHKVEETVRKYSINPNLLKLELTESLLLEHTEKTIESMNILKSIGVRLSLDDFGIGYSSLQYLKRLPLDQLKIDQSFVRDIVIDKDDKTIVRTIIAMAHSMNLNVIAEGVETEEQQNILQEIGCNHFQGYLYGKPVPIENFESFLI